MRVAFLGTPDFGVPSLRALAGAGYDIAGVFTQPDRPRGRGKKLSPCPVKAAALELGLPVYAFERIRGQVGLDALRALHPDVMVTAAFGQILSQKILDVPPYGCVNVHGSLLPKYRGPAPIQWAIINGERETGITTMKTARGVDSGDILLRRRVTIGEAETAGELFDRLSVLGAEVLLETLEGLQAGDITPIPQNEAEATHFPMLKKEDGRLDFEKTPGQIADLVRGVSPWPVAYTHLPGGDVLKVHAAMPAQGAGSPGQVLAAQDALVIACAQGAVELKEVQPPSGKVMAAADYLRGHPIEQGEILPWR